MKITYIDDIIVISILSFIGYLLYHKNLLLLLLILLLLVIIVNWIDSRYEQKKQQRRLDETYYNFAKGDFNHTIHKGLSRYILHRVNDSTVIFEEVFLKLLLSKPINTKHKRILMYMKEHPLTKEKIRNALIVKDQCITYLNSYLLEDLSEIITEY